MSPTSPTSPANERTVLTGARVVLPDGVAEDVTLTVEGRLIAGILRGDPPETPPEAHPHARPAALTLDLSGHWIVPGFVDMHVHGGGGASFSAGTAEEALRVIGTHRRHGTTTMVASTVTGELADLAGQAGALSELVEQGELAGVHFEGPFISPRRCGAHDPALLRDPDPTEVRKLVDAARGTARMMTLAPELPGGLDSVRMLADSGVVAAVGHTDSTYEATAEAVEAGARVATHLFNAMPALGHRAPGPVAALLEDERITVELINDGVHLHPSVLELAFRRAGAGRVAFITDAMGAAGMGDGRYPLGPLEVEVRDGVARLTDGGLDAHPRRGVPPRRDGRRASRDGRGARPVAESGAAAGRGRPYGLAGDGQVRRPGGARRGVPSGGRDAAGRVDGAA
jgi:N-acetylglucosamine-6-phosphate deacetylase